MEQLSISKCCYDNCILYIPYTAQKMKLSIKDFSSKCNQIRRFLRIWSHLLEKSLMENFIFCAVLIIIDEKLFFSKQFSYSMYLLFFSQDFCIYWNQSQITAREK